MAKVIYMNGILSGRLGGLVYAYNKAGNYVRTFRAPTDAATPAQLNNRARLAQASSAWHALDDIIKGQWNTYAVTMFKPKFSTPGTRFSGFNAFVSLQNVAKNMLAKSAEVNISAPPANPDIILAYAPVTVAPLLEFSANIQDLLGVPVGFTVIVDEFNVTSGITFTINFDRSINAGTGTNGPNFSDAIGNIPAGIAFVGSLPLSQAEQFVENPDINLLAITYPIGQITAWTTGSTFTAHVANVPEIASRKNTYQTGDIVQIKAYLVGQNGATQPLNTNIVTASN